MRILICVYSIKDVTWSKVLVDSMTRLYTPSYIADKNSDATNHIDKKMIMQKLIVMMTKIWVRKSSIPNISPFGAYSDTRYSIDFVSIT